MYYYTQNFYTPPKPLSFFQGGLFIGIFLPGPPITNTSSDLLGNKNTGSAITYKTYAEGFGDKNNIWGLILATKNYLSGPNTYDSYRQITEPYINFNTSSYDGLFNKQQSTKFNEKLKNVSYGGYKDWYVPSVDELAFICKNLPVGYYVPRRFDAMTSNIYRSSTVSIKMKNKENIDYLPQRISDNKFSLIPKSSYSFYGQSFRKTKYGTVMNVDEFSTETPIRLVRKVILIKSEVQL
jgi:hypothetical protein